MIQEQKQTEEEAISQIFEIELSKLPQIVADNETELRKEGLRFISPAATLDYCKVLDYHFKDSTIRVKLFRRSSTIKFYTPNGVREMDRAREFYQLLGRFGL